MKFLIQIVMKQQTDTISNPKESDARKEATKKNLNELLSQHTQAGQDPMQAWRMSVFGAQGAGSVLNCRELSRQDKVALLRVGVGKHLLDPETEAKLLASEPRLELEFSDPMKASTLTFKFVALKTPFQMPVQGQQFPSKVYMTFKFFNFAKVHTETCVLRAIGQDEGSNVIKMGAQYLL